MNVVLIGMPGAGKSTVGVLAAKALGMDFTDTDLVIQTERGKTLAEIIAERGPSGFSEIEDDTLARLERDNCVIATGGSAVFCEKGMAHLAEGGRTIYLRVEPDDLRARLGNIRTRNAGRADRRTRALLRALRRLHRGRTRRHRRHGRGSDGDSPLLPRSVTSQMTKLQLFFGGL